uniref:F-box domain-containing protein n=2 Tax=Steinernema glaseri TaxID=37863 RepID=A0A1I8AF73_9BILA
MSTREKVPTGKGNKVSYCHTFGSPHGPSLSKCPVQSPPTMESVPVVFLDALCATLKKKDLNILQQIVEPWMSTVTTHYSRRREIRVSLHVNPEGTEVGIRVVKIGVFGASVNLESFVWSKYDRIRYIQMNKFDQFGAQPLKMPLERFRTKVLPLLNSFADAYDLDISSFHRYRLLMDTLFSGLRAPALIRTGNFGENCIKFVEQKIASDQLQGLDLLGTEWAASMKATLKSFLKSQNFMKLDLFGTNLTVDKDMLIIMFERFFNGDLRKGTRLQGRPSDEMTDIHRALESGDTLPSLGRLLEQRATIRRELNHIRWARPGQASLHAWFVSPELVHIYVR